jgi:hypothetical protein
MPEYVQAQTGSLYGEEDLLRRAAADRFVISQGVKRKLLNEAVHAKGRQLADSATGPAVTADYYYGSMNDAGSMGGAMPPSAGVYYQKGKGRAAPQASQQQSEYGNIFSMMLGGLCKEVVEGVKDGIYRIISQGNLILRDFIMTKANSMGRMPNLVSSLYAMGADVGPVQRMIDDSCDRLEILTDEQDCVLAYRTYNTRKPTPLIQWLRKGKVEQGAPLIPRQGRAVEFDDIIFTHEGQIQGFKEEAGGQPLRGDQIMFDQFYADSDTENWVTHWETKTSNPARFRQNIIDFTLSHYIYATGNAKRDYLYGKLESGKDMVVQRISLPYGYGLSNWDQSLFLKTAGRAIGIYVTHPFYSFFEKALAKAGRIDEAKKVEQGEVNRMYVPDRPPILRVGYG